MSSLSFTTEGIIAFLDWTRRKIQLHYTPLPDGFFYREGDFWWASLGQNIGFEENGKHTHFERPVLILKGISKELFFAVPTTRTLRQGRWFHTYKTERGEFSLLLGQLRSLSTRRLIRRLGRMDEKEFQFVQKKMGSFFHKKSEPPELIRRFLGIPFGKTVLLS